MATTKKAKKTTTKRKAARKTTRKATKKAPKRAARVKTCRFRTKGMKIGEVRTRTSASGHKYEIARVK